MCSNPFINSYYKTFDIEMSTSDVELRKNNNEIGADGDMQVFVVLRRFSAQSMYCALKKHFKESVLRYVVR